MIDKPIQNTVDVPQHEVAAVSNDDMTQKKWYVIHAYSGCEQLVKQALQERIVRDNLSSKFGDILVPTEEVVELRAGLKKKSLRKFFPGYVLVAMVMDEETWHLVRSVPKVMGFIGGTSDKPAAISVREVDAILNRISNSSEKPRPKILFEIGEVVRVIDGPFSDFNGVVEEVNYEKSRLRVAVIIFGRSTPVELQFDQVEKS
jgi:transcriptional antiterminator NusG